MTNHGVLVGYDGSIGAAAIVVGPHGSSAAREILLGSAMALLHHTDRPVVVVPGRRSRPVD
jgi:nucleotide-binding universal stress UspA family protein